MEHQGGDGLRLMAAVDRGQVQVGEDIPIKRQKLLGPEDFPQLP